MSASGTSLISMSIRWFLPFHFSRTVVHVWRRGKRNDESTDYRFLNYLQTLVLKESSQASNIFFLIQKYI